MMPATPDDNHEAQPETPVPTIPVLKALEFLHRINIKLEELERGLSGVTIDDHLIRLINQAIATLQRLRGDAATDMNAA
jgi:hypothetical protein